MFSQAKNIVIKCQNLSKIYNLQKQKTFKEFLPAFFSGKTLKNKLVALKELNFQLEKGESLAIIGANGSGKSTLLKLIAAVTQPTKGQFEVHGKIAPLIELGAGFHPELTGKENVYLNGSILGIKNKEMNRLYPSIVAFAELEAFMDQPIKHYSSGMYMRLAFSVAVAETPDILLLDEILAVGDLSFQKKCLTKLAEFQKKDATLIMVNHNLTQVSQYCHKGLLLKEGQQIYFGDIQQAIGLYENMN